MIEICLKDDNMHRFVMINALICINICVITCINSMLSVRHLDLLFNTLHQEKEKKGESVSIRL